MPGSLRIARLAGIDVRVHASWLLIFGLVFVQLTSVFPESYPFWSDTKVLTVAAITAVLFFASVVAHEFAHALVARSFRMEVSSITLFVLGGVANLTKEPTSARAEFFMAIAGPATSLVLGFTGIGIAAAADAPSLQPVRAVAETLGPVNLILAAFNMVPGFPLDGGRVLRSVIWGFGRNRSAATRIAARGGQLVAALLAIYGATFLGQRGELVNGLWYFLIAYFLWSAASASLTQERSLAAVRGARVRELMVASPRSAEPGMTVGRAVSELVLPFNLRAIPVVRDGKPLGLATIADLRAVDHERWASTTIESIMRPLADLATVGPDDPLSRALERFGETDVPVLPVIDGGALTGLLMFESLEGYIRMREMLGADGVRRS